MMEADRSVCSKISDILQIPNTFYNILISDASEDSRSSVTSGVRIVQYHI